jgi:hypothetical protein
LLLIPEGFAKIPILIYLCLRNQNNNIMGYTTLTQRVKETLKSYISGDRLRVAIVDTDNGIMLKVALMDWGGFEVAYFTKTRYLAVHRTICGKDLAKLCVELRSYYGDECDLTSRYTKGVLPIAGE